MAKKQVKNKSRNPRKPIRRKSSPSDKTNEPESAEHCNHCSKNQSDIQQILSKILSGGIPACDFCREEPVNKKGGKQTRNKSGGKPPPGSGGGVEMNPIWVCLDCGRHFCGGDVSIMEPYGHSRRHAKQDKHAWAVKFSDPLVCWCFTCNSTIAIELPDITKVAGDQKTVEEKEIKDNVVCSNGLESVRGNTLRGLMNLGNTCFMNSVMQNLFAVDMLREYLVKLNRPVGPMTMALKKLFVETSAAENSKGVLSMKSLFACVCAKAPQFRGYQQQDSHEFLCHLFDGLHSEEINARKMEESSDQKGKANSRTSFVDEIFGGLLSSTVCCKECGYTSVVHEPFLDLSLPIPAKKAQQKKGQPPPSKKAKQLIRDRSRSRRVYEWAVTKEPTVSENWEAESESTLHENKKAGTVGPQPEVSVSSFPIGPQAKASLSSLPIGPQAETSALILPTGPRAEASVSNRSEGNQNPTAEVGEISWLDFLDSSLEHDNPDPFSFSEDQCSQNEQVLQVENHVESSSKAPTCSEEAAVPVDGVVSTRDEVSSSSIQDGSVILLPYKDIDVTEGMNNMTMSSQDSENSASKNAPVFGLNLVPSSVPQPEEDVDDFGGFGNLFDEPEVTSEIKKETSVVEDMDVNFWGTASNDYNEDEIDDSSSPVSISSCLALFTKPEILSDEQAWYCEHCSEVSSRQDARHKKRSQQPLPELKPSETSTSLGDGNEVQRINAEKASVYSGNSTENENLDNGMNQSSTVDSVLDRDTLDQPDAGLDAQRSFGLMGGLQVSSSGSSHLSHGNYVLLKNEAQEDPTCNRTACHTSDNEEIVSTEEDSCDRRITFYSNSDQSTVLDNEPILTSSHAEDVIVTVCQVDDKAKGKRESHLQNGKMRPMEKSSKEAKPSSSKVKRAATKRFLINKAPAVLIVHLKRFSQDFRGRLNKLSGHVDFQETLDLRPYMDARCKEKSKCMYRLIGVVEHGGTMRGGHYVAYVRGQVGTGTNQKGIGPRWLYASDAHVHETTLSEVLRAMLISSSMKE